MKNKEKIIKNPNSTDVWIPLYKVQIHNNEKSFYKRQFTPEEIGDNCDKPFLDLQ